MRKMPPPVALANRAGDSRDEVDLVPCGAVLAGAGTAPFRKPATWLMSFKPVPLNSGLNGSLSGVSLKSPMMAM